eukprot:5521504-Prymnesium_polylepis.1
MRKNSAPVRKSAVFSDAKAIRKSAVFADEDVPVIHFAMHLRRLLSHPYTLNALWWFSRIASVLYVAAVIGLSIKADLVVSINNQRTFTPVVPALLALLLLEVAVRLSISGRSVFLKDYLQLLDAVVLLLALLIELTYLILDRRAPHWDRFTVIAVRSMLTLRTARDSHELELRRRVCCTKATANFPQPSNRAAQTTVRVRARVALGRLKAQVGAGRSLRGRNLRYSARKLTYTLASLMVMLGVVLQLQGAVLAFEIGHTRLLEAPLRTQVDWAMTLPGGGFIVIGFASSVGAYMSVNKEMTLKLMVATTVAALLVALLGQTSVGAWDASMALGRRVHFSADTPSASREALQEALGGWNRTRRGFEEAWEKCNGAVYNTTISSPACAQAWPGGPCASYEQNHLVLFCGDNADVRSNQRRVHDLIHWASGSAEKHTKYFKLKKSLACMGAANAHFALMMSTLCMTQSIPHLLRRLDSHDFKMCEESAWWPSPPATTDRNITVRGDGRRRWFAPRDSPPPPRNEFWSDLFGEADAPGGVRRARNYTVAQLQSMTVPDLLGRGHMPMSAKRLFCLCESSKEFAEMIDSYTSLFTTTSVVVLLFALLVLVGQCCFCCAFEDSSHYYDPDLL